MSQIALKQRLRLLSLVTFLFTISTTAFAADKPYRRTLESYVMPDVTLVNQDGKKIRFKSAIESNKPVVVDFVYGTCTTICPVLSAGYASLQNRLGVNVDKVHLVSVSIDPENDTPRVMKEYLKRYRGKAGWDFFTGSRADIDLVLKSFESTFRTKMDHKPLTFIRMPEDGRWIRIFGLISSREFIEEVKNAGVKL